MPTLCHLYTNKNGEHAMTKTIRVAILDDHQPIIDGYLYRLSQAPDIKIVGTALFGEDLEPMLNGKMVDVLILDISVPISADNSNPYPVQHAIPQLLERYPDLAILVISMYRQRSLIQSIMETGVNGYILKDDRASIQELASIIRSLVQGGVHLSQQAYQVLIQGLHSGDEPLLSVRQVEALSLCAAYPDGSQSELAKTMKLANSTMRNLLSEAYIRLGVRTRQAAVTRARQLGLLQPDVHPMIEQDEQ
jgi:two-component system nitrate/nitrite response regulator NarL